MDEETIPIEAVRLLVGDALHLVGGIDTLAVDELVGVAARYHGAVVE